jgi:hypothetical protein
VIVISGALVLVALVLLVLGLTMQDLAFVYGSIAVSLISFVFLVVGILQRRGDQPATADGPEVSEGSGTADEQDASAAASTSSGSGAATPEPVLAPSLRKGGSVRAAGPDGDEPDDDELLDDDLDEEYEVGATVLVVPGRPRYHVAGCRYLNGKAAEEVDLAEAREQYSACGVCKPDQILEQLEDELLEDDVEEVALEEPAEDDPEVVEEDAEFEDVELEDEPADIDSGGVVEGAELAAAEDDAFEDDAFEDDTFEDGARADDVVDSGVPGAGESELEAEPAPGRRGGSRRVGSVPVASTGRSRAASRVSGRSTAGAGVAARKEPRPESADGATGIPAMKAPSKGRPSKVVVIPERGKFHTATCRFVRDTLGTEELTRTQATKQGFSPCGVCKP